MPKRKRRRDDDDDGDYGETWEPSKGDELSGEIVRKDKVETQYGMARVVEIEDDEGDRWTVWCGSVLRKKLYSQVDEGDYVTLTYKGKKGKGKFAKKMYDVVIGDEEDDDEDDEDDD